jgi:hypothetical protein
MLTLLLIILLPCLSNCTLTPPNVPVCREKDIDKGRCTYIVSGKSFDVDETHLFEGKTWYEQRTYFILVPISSWAELKSYIVKMCEKYKNCQTTDTTVKSIDGML